MPDNVSGLRKPFSHRTDQIDGEKSVLILIFFWDEP